MKIELQREFFAQKERPFVRGEQLEADLIKFKSGIPAVRLRNRFGYIDVLPYHGQMIWDAVFNGRSLKMMTPFDEPRDVDSFLDTYGCYMMHCGALRMGCPGPDDEHLQHGELPYAKYASASVTAGEDAKGEYIGLAGVYEYNRAFGDHYYAEPEVKLYAESMVLEVSIRIENLACKPMEMMYMCHINNRAVPGGRIVQALPWTKQHMTLRDSAPKTVQVDEIYRRFLKEINENIQRTERINEEDVYDPEIVFFLNRPKTDEDGWTHFMYVRPDGSADYTCYKPDELDHCSRWIVRSKSMEALGLALPATADAEGYLAEKEKGNILTIAPKQTFQTTIRVGCLNKDDSKKVEDWINQILI